MAVIRRLDVEDRPALEAFLDHYRASSMFLRSNLRFGGIKNGQDRYQGLYIGAFSDGILTDVAAHYWNNNIVLQAPTCPVDVATAAAAASGRVINGVIGPWAQVKAVEPEMDLDRSRLGKVVPEYLYALDLAVLKLPEPLMSGAVCHRRATPDDLDLLVAWRRVYDRVTMGFPEQTIRDDLNRDMLSGMIADKRLWLLEHNSLPVAMSGFNAVLPDTVQVGGVFTDENNRAQGYARALVAATLQDAQKAGATEALLFTEMDNIPAQRAYESLGFERVGDYGMVVLDPS